MLVSYSVAGLTPELLDAGARAIAAHGFHAVTLEQIAAEAGLSRVTLHRRGVGKTDVLSGLVDRATADYRERMWPVLTATGAVPTRLQAALRVLCEVAEEHLPLLLAVRSLSDGIFHEPETGADEGAQTRDVFTEPLARLLHEGQADGSLVVLDVADEATVLFNVVGWTYIHLRTGHGWSPERASTAVLGLALRGTVQGPAAP